MKRSTVFLMCFSLVVLTGLFSLPSTVLAEKSWLVPTAQEAGATSGNYGVVNTDVTNWVTGEVSRVSLAGATVNQQPFAATPVRWFKKFKEKLKGEQGDPGPPGPAGPPGPSGGGASPAYYETPGQQFFCAEGENECFFTDSCEEGDIAIGPSSFGLSNLKSEPPVSSWSTSRLDDNSIQYKVTLFSNCERSLGCGRGGTKTLCLDLTP